MEDPNANQIAAMGAQFVENSKFYFVINCTGGWILFLTFNLLTKDHFK